MPNTLAHAGAQGIATRTALPDADLRWVYLGCVIPDVPWILQRAVHATIPGVDPYLLRSYVVIQASLLGCLLLSGAAALLARSFLRTWAVLGGNAGIHLVLDAMQTKWGSGVHFLAPVSWKQTNWALFWPESFISYALTALGLGYFLWFFRPSLDEPLDLLLTSPARWTGGMILLLAYFTLPLMLLQAPIEANTHCLETLHTAKDRVGRSVAFDRARYVETQGKSFLKYYNNSERVSVAPLPVKSPATVSLRGIFVSGDKVRATEYHLHAGRLRSYASYLGLALITFVWIMAVNKTGRPD